MVVTVVRYNTRGCGAVCATWHFFSLFSHDDDDDDDAMELID